ncbi:acyl-CoA thioesterase [Parahaliea mediterranea]|uniref:Thioesterase family protein n=1 Tax=Parahaliea mediterranea TaxID=651086 RepID=A0A939ILG9_9GAMM|nr:thioesterase family protein [Parahaliea mediterranea]MBN7795963.1 thioesterase family protein [Parahaliea mediterranea]
MPRKIIDLPDTFVFRTDYVVLYSDVNNANHLGSDRVLPIALEAQLRFIKHLGHRHAIAFEDAGLIMAHSEIAYLAEAHHGDQLSVELGADHFEDKSFQLRYRISKLDSGQEVARVVTTMLFFDYERSAVIPVPAEFRAHFHREP